MLKGNSREPFLLFLIIAGIVAFVILQNIQITRIKVRDSIRKKDLAKMQSVLEHYYTEHKSYPLTYPQEFPKDPVKQLNYFYQTSTDRQKYHLLARIENTKDTEYARGLEGNCGASCTYGVTNHGGNVTEELK